jgi:hypothetical protein
VAVAADTAALVSLRMPVWCCGYRIAACGCAAVDGGGVRVAVHCSVTRHLVFDFDRGAMHFTK